MTEVKDKDVKSWAESFLKDVKIKVFKDILTKEEMVGLLREAVKIIKRLLTKI